MERARSSLGRHVPDGWGSGERLVVFLALVGKWSRVSGIARRGLRRRSLEIPLATDNEYAMHSGRRDRDEGEPPSRPVGSLQHHLLLSPEHTHRELRSVSALQQQRIAIMPTFISLLLALVIFASAFGFMIYRDAERRAREKRRNQYHDRV